MDEEANISEGGERPLVNNKESAIEAKSLTPHGKLLYKCSDT